MHAHARTHIHKAGVGRSYLASQCESVAEAGYRSSGLSFSLFVLQGVTIPAPSTSGHTHPRPGLTASVSICSITGSCIVTTMRKKEHGNQTCHSPDKPGTSHPLPILVLLIFLLPASPAGRALGSTPQPLGLPCGFPGSPAAHGTCGALQSSRDLETERTQLPAHLQPHARAKSAGKTHFHLVH